MESTTLQKNNFSAEKWEIIILDPERDYFTADEVIDAYFKGKKIGLSQVKKALIRSFSSNIEKTVKYRNKVLEFLQKKKFHPITSYLNIVSWDKFEILIVVPEKELLENRFLDVYNFVSEFENKINEELFNLLFSFTNSSKEFDETKLEADGFILKHKL